MTVRKYSECKDIFWDEKSFNYRLMIVKYSLIADTL